MAGLLVHSFPLCGLTSVHITLNRTPSTCRHQLLSYSIVSIDRNQNQVTIASTEPYEDLAGQGNCRGGLHRYLLKMQ